jgi:2-oxo-3-hexenedioate decarboxylase/2-keto-4-pentenoate hydratase
MTPAEIDALAAKIAEARRSRAVNAFLGPATADISEEDAYRVQFAVQAKLTETGADRQAGWKVALATPDLYKPAGLSGPAFAGIYQSGIRFDGARFEKGWPIKAGIECEVVARLATDCNAKPKPYDATSIAEHVANLYCGMEVVENRYADITKINGRGRVCDDVLQAACVIGTEIKDWRTRDLAAMQGSSSHEGKQLAAGPGSAVMGGALVSLAWLANKLIEHGKRLRAGDIVLTGSVHVPQFLAGPGLARTEFAGVGGCSVTFG